MVQFAIQSIRNFSHPLSSFLARSFPFWTQKDQLYIISSGSFFSFVLIQFYVHLSKEIMFALVITCGTCLLLWRSFLKIDKENRKAGGETIHSIDGSK